MYSVVCFGADGLRQAFDLKHHWLEALIGKCNRTYAAAYRSVGKKRTIFAIINGEQK